MGLKEQRSEATPPHTKGPSKPRRLYYYTGKQWGLKSLWENRLKVARYGDLNDPFELRSISFQDKEARAFWEQEVARLIDGHSGLLCFSSDWRSTLMWSHYGEKHTGMCLGFDVPWSDAIKIRYVSERRPRDDFGTSLGISEVTRVVEDAMRFKYDGWSYENEWRLKVPLTKAVDGIHFKHFDDSLCLREVILGPRCSLQPGEVIEAVTNPPLDVEIYKARAAFGRFEICRDRLVDMHTKQGFRAALALAKTLYADDLP